MRLALPTLVLGALVVASGIAFPASAGAPTVTHGVLASFDGTSIVYTFFLPEGASAEAPVPLVLMTHGWAGSRTSTPTGIVADLLDRGYAVLTWDSRGFGQSGGFVELDSPDFEVRDTMALLDMAAAHPAIAHENGDPVVGMAGGSYAGGIQLLTAAFDPRIDAIVPDITWNDLRTSLGPGGVPKEGWIQVLFGAGAATGTAYGMDPRGGYPGGPQAQSYTTNLPSWYAQVHAANGVTPEVDEGLAYRSISQYMDAVQASVLLTQGWPDTLFTPNEAVANYQALLAQGNEVQLLLYCGGHAGCPYVSDGAYVRARTLDFLDHVLQGTGALGANVEWQDNEGAWHGSAVWPPAGTQWAHASASATLVSTPAPTGGGGFAVGAGGVNTGPQKNPLHDEGVGTMNVPVMTPSADTQIVGIGSAHLEVAGTGTEAFLFLRLVDLDTGAVLDDQTQAIRIPVGGSADVDLVGVSYVLPAGHTLALQVSTSDVAHATNRAPGAFDVTVSVDVPFVA